MPILEDNILPIQEPQKRPYLGSPDTQQVEIGFAPLVSEDIAINTQDRRGKSIEELSRVESAGPPTFASPMGMVSRGELLANKRYPVWQRDVDLENIYGLQQPWYAQLGNGLIKMATTAAGTFLQGYATIPSYIEAARTGELNKLAGGPDGFEAKIDEFRTNMSDRFPNYMTRYEREHPLLSMIPFHRGNANFWGEQVLENLGFTIGAIGSAVSQDAIIGAATGAVGEIPLIAGQVGKASLWLNKLFAGTKDVAKLLETGEDVLNMSRLKTLANLTKIRDGGRYALNLVGAARTEAGVEARDGYRQVKEELIKQYKLEHLGEEPTGADLQEIEDFSINSMNIRFGINMALLTVSDAIQWDAFLKSFNNIRKGAAAGVAKKIQGAGTIGLKEGSMDVFETKVPAGVIGKTWDNIKPALPLMFTEGVYEEGGQYAAERGTYDYYTRMYKDPSKGKNKETWDQIDEVVKSTVYGLGEQFGTIEGFQNMVVGALTAIITSGVRGRIDAAQGMGREQRRQQAINLLNQYGITGVLGDNYSNTADSIRIVNEMKEAADKGDVFKFKNLKSDLFFNMVMSRIPSGLHDVTIEQLSMLKDLDKEEFEKYFGVDFTESNKQTVDQYVNSMINKADEIKSSYDTINRAFRNPFVNYINPTKEQEDEKNKYDTFNRWKTDLTYYATVPSNINERLQSITERLQKISPLLNTEVVSRVTNRESLIEMAEEYSKQASDIESSINNLTTGKERIEARKDARNLRTLSERINLMIRNNEWDERTISFLLNFELNGETRGKEDVIPPQFIDDLIIYGVDINRLNSLRTRVKDIYNALSSKKGFEKYFDQAERIREEKEPEVEEETTHTFKNKAGEVEPIEQGREYVLPDVKLATKRKNRVRFPDNISKDFDTEELAIEARNEANRQAGALSRVRILALNPDGTVKVEDLSENIQNISLSDLEGYEKVQTEEEKLMKNKETLDKEQDGINKDSGDINTGDPKKVKDEIVAKREGALKPYFKFFISTITESEDYENPEKSAPHVVRSREFLNNAKTFPNRANLRVILVTPKTEEALGLKGLTALSYGRDVDIKESTDPNNGFIAAVFTEQEGNKLYFIDKEGKRIGEVKKETPLERVVFQTMPTTKSTDSKGNPRYRGKEQESFMAMSKLWLLERTKLLDETEWDGTNYAFAISRGIPRIDPNNERHHVGGLIIPEDRIKGTQSLIEVCVDGNVTHKGQNISFPKGTALIHFDDLLDYLNNNKLGEEKAKNVYQVIKAFAREIQDQNDAGKKVTLNTGYVRYLQNVLYYSTKGAGTSDNRIFIDTGTMNISLGGINYPISRIGEMEKEITEKLKDTFHNVNRRTLSAEQFSKPFIEYVFENGELKPIPWLNYQTYLLSAKYPKDYKNGNSRPVNETPLVTDVALPGVIPYTFAQKYATLIGLDFPVQSETKEEKAPVVTPPEPITKIGEYEIDGETVNSIKPKAIEGSIDFVAAMIGNNLKVTVIPNETSLRMSKNEDYMKKIVDDLTKLGLDTNKSSEQLFMDQMALQLEKHLWTLKSAEEKKQAPKTEEKKETVSTDIEARKADIERRRQISLKETLNKRMISPRGIGLTQLGTLIGTYYRWQTTLVTGQKLKHPIEEPVMITSDIIWQTSKGKDSEKFQQAVEDIKNRINTLYDNELEALEEKPKKEEGPGINLTDKNNPKSDPYRRVGKEEEAEERMTDIDIERFKAWREENVPNIPYEIMENLIATYDNEEAWGSFEKGTIKFYRRAIKGTEYHEAFEAIWKGFLSPEERQLILNDERTRGDFFTDRQTKERIAYINATDEQIKERIADDFGDYTLGKLPVRSLGERVLRFFKAIIEWFKSFGRNKSLKTKLFEEINKGRFKEAVLPKGIEREAPVYKRLPGISETKAWEFVQDMAIRASNYIFGEHREDIFNPNQVTGEQVRDYIKSLYSDEGGKYQEIERVGEGNFDALFKRTKELLRTIGINFDEEDRLDLNDIETNNKAYAPEPFSTDWKKYSPFAVKFLLSTLPVVKATNQQNSTSLKLPERKISDVKGYLMNSYSRIFSTLMTKLSNTYGTDKLIEKLLDVAKYDANYMRVFQRIGGDLSNGSVSFENFTADDWRLFINFYQVFTKQRPDALIQYKKEGEVFTAPADIYAISKKVQQDWFERMKALSEDPTSIIIKNRSTKSYQVKDLNAIIEKTDDGRYKVTNYNNESTYYKTEEKAKEAARDRSFPVKNSEEMIEFLSQLGVNFPKETYLNLKDDQRDTFARAVGRIRSYLGENKDIGKITGRTLGINEQLVQLSNLYVSVNNPNQENTHTNIQGTLSQNYEENNTASIFENEFNEAATLAEVIQRRPELNDIFSKNSVTLKPGRLFIDKDGNRIKEFKVGYIEGTDDVDKGKKIKTTRLSRGDRMSLEINQNLHGEYYILIPAEGSTQWMLNLGNNISFEDIQGDNWKDIYRIFRGYLEDDIALALDSENREKLKNVGKRAKELRFFKNILDKETLSAIDKMIKDNATEEDIRKYVSDHSDKVNASVRRYIESKAEKVKKTLRRTKQLTDNKDSTYNYPNLDDRFINDERRINKIDKHELSEKDVNNVLTFVNVNHVIANIEFHKLIFGDPYQFALSKKGKLEEIKRVKSFLSPRRLMYDSPEHNTWLNREYNKAGDIELTPKDPGYHLHKSYAVTATLADVSPVSNLFGTVKKEADSFSIIMDGAYREVKEKNGQWSKEAQEWHNWQMAYTRQNMKGYIYTNEALRKYDRELIATPEPEFVTDIMKPIVSGVKSRKNTAELVIDKMAQMPLYFKAVQGSALEQLYTNMFEEKIDYVIFESGRKVGVEKAHVLYDEKNGWKFNLSPFEENTKVEVSWKSYGIQVETSYEKEKEQTRISQLTKMSSIDMFDNGVAISDEVQEAYDRHKAALDKIHENNYNVLLRNLGIESTGDGFELRDPKAISETLIHEMMRRQLSNNAKDTIQLNEDGQFTMDFEASNEYKQIKDILYSMIHKALISPKMHGGMMTQAPVTLWENTKEGRGIAIKTEDGWRKISRKEYETLSDEEKGKVVLTSDTLKFYEDETGKRYCEMLLPYRFRRDFDEKRFPISQSVISHLNNTTEGRSILRGISARIPLQSMASVELFKAAGFLEKSMGDVVIVPSEITEKTNSDFDIDKQNMYFKSVYKDEHGEIRLVTYKGSEDETKEFYGDVFDNTIYRQLDRINKNIESNKELLSVLQAIGSVPDLQPTLTKEQYAFYSNNIDTIYEIIQEAEEAEISPYDYVSEQLGVVEEEKGEKLAKLLNFKMKEEYVERMYRRALENEYYESIEDLVGVPQNFSHLTTPVDDAGLGKVADQLDALRGQSEIEEQDILDMDYMSSMRHAFVTCKHWMGIVVSNIMAHAVHQKTRVYLDPKKFSLLNTADRAILGNGSIILPHNTVEIDGQERVSLSGVKTADGSNEYISNRLSGYTTAIVDAPNDPFIVKIIDSDMAVSTVMFLESIGSGKYVPMFINQPIIKEYLSFLNNTNYRYLYKKANIDYIKDKFPATDNEIRDAQVDIDNFANNIERYYKEGRFEDGRDNAVQRVIFNEFLKYSKMAEYNFSLTQAFNYDMSRFRSADSFSRKKTRTEIAAMKNIFSSVDEILEANPTGVQKDFLDKSMSAMGAVFKLEQDQFKVITGDVLRPFEEQQYMSADDFDKIATKVKASFLDYIIQTQSGINMLIKDLTTGDNSVAKQVEKARERHPDMKILQDLTIRSTDRMDGAKTVTLNARPKEAYDKDLYTEMMAELKGVEPELYKRLVKLIILQGTYQTGVSIKHIVPLEDYAAEVKPYIDNLVSTPDIQNFSKGAFYKSNWQDDDIVPHFVPRFYEEGYIGSVGFDTDLYQYTSRNFTRVAGDSAEALFWNTMFKERKLMRVSAIYNPEVKSEFIKVKRIIKSQDGDTINFITGQTLPKSEYIRRKANGDMFLYDVLGYQRVNQADGTPLMTSSGEYLYKLVNLWGDGQYAVEYYTDNRPSVLDNGTVKIRDERNPELSGELNDADIVKYFAPLTSQKTIIEDSSDMNNVTITSPLMNITFQEDQNVGYRERTIKNASMDVTIAIAADFNSAGEILTKNSVLGQKKLYLPVSTDVFASKAEVENTAGLIAQKIISLGKKEVSINIAGNGIYTLNNKLSGYTQSMADRSALELLTGVKRRLDEAGVKISMVRTGGQTGFDEAGAKAGMALGIPTTILAPKGWKFRNEKGQDISNEQSFKSRFTSPSKEAVSAEVKKEAPILNDINRDINTYSGGRTKSQNVVLPTDLGGRNKDIFSVMDKFKKENPSGIIAYRVNNSKSLLQNLKEQNAIGNPFNWTELGYETSHSQFISWLTTGNNFNNKNATEEYRQAIIDLMQKSKGQKILYYTELGKPSHATSLDYLINQYFISDEEKQMYMAEELRKQQEEEWKDKDNHCEIPF